ncbi:MAG: hypothetical protein AABO41_27660 [Acidobacteriota bacterium]
MKTDLSPTFACSLGLRVLVLAITLSSMVLIQGCASDAAPEGGAAVEYPAGVSDDIEQQLKYDARVESSEPDPENGENLVVNVNDSWASSPQGMQERAVGQWYSLWHGQHGGKVIVKYDGNPVASWSVEGYKPEKPASAQVGAESES